MTAQEFFKNDRFATNAGVELIEIKEGYSKARLVITAEHLNAGGRTQGGAIFTLADLALAAAANSHGTLAFSLSSNITFLRSSRHGRCTVCRSTRTLHRPHHRILPDRRHQPGGKTDCHFRIQCI
ncbi:PaaI family thioesterase [Bacteroides uniformis]|nr:PaaI family thioesterase [Bacteroides uniformis]